MAQVTRPLPVSVIVLTKDEALNLPGCLASLKWAKQVVVVDSKSQDGTAAIARRWGANVYVRPWPGFTAQRNFALSKCRQPWVLSVDADERVGPDLRESIAKTLAEGPAFDGYDVPEVNLYFGRWLRHGGIYPGGHMVFYRRDQGRYQPGAGDIHEGVRISRRGRLNGHLIHHAFPDIEFWMSKFNHYTDLEAQGRFSKGQAVGLWNVFVKPAQRFLKTFLGRQGFRDGVQGLLYCFTYGYYTFMIKLKIWELKRRQGAA